LYATAYGVQHCKRELGFNGWSCSVLYLWCCVVEAVLYQQHIQIFRYLPDTWLEFAGYPLKLQNKNVGFKIDKQK
jgi:hypothetical protein